MSEMREALPQRIGYLRRAPQLSYNFLTLLADGDHTFSMIVYALSV